MLKPTYRAFASVNMTHAFGENLWGGTNGEFFIGITMPNEREEWYVTTAKNTMTSSFAEDVAELLKQTHGDLAHLYALERVVRTDSTVGEVKLWREVLTILDKEVAK